MEEFGNDAHDHVDYATRNAVYGAVYDVYLNALKDTSVNLRGAGFWQWEFSTGLDPAASDKGYVV